MIFTENLQKLGTAFRQHGFQLRVVGGAVRDSMLGLEPKDIDLCTDATPTEMIELVEDMGFAYIPTGLQHGTITIIVNDEQFEVTTLRVDAETDGRHAVVEYTRDFQADAARRDLTINAMSMDFSGKIYDYFGGMNDLAAARVRFVGNPDERVKEDYLRILRYFRFSARFGGLDLDQVKEITTRENLEGLKKISVERYWLEMQKLVMLPFADDVLACMYYTGVLNALGLEKPNRSIGSIGVSPVGGLSTMITVNSIDSFLSKWKLSAVEEKHLRYLVTNRKKRNYWQNDLVDGIPREWVLDLHNLSNEDPDTIYWMCNWKIPTFPVTGQDLLNQGFKPGKVLGDKLKALREEWKNSCFTLTKNDLLTNFN